MTKREKYIRILITLHYASLTTIAVLSFRGVGSLFDGNIFFNLTQGISLILGIYYPARAWWWLNQQPITGKITEIGLICTVLLLLSLLTLHYEWYMSIFGDGRFQSGSLNYFIIYPCIVNLSDSMEKKKIESTTEVS